MKGIVNSLELIAQFRGDSLTETISKVEDNIKGRDARSLLAYEKQNSIGSALLSAALEIKKQSAQIDNLVTVPGT